MELSKNNIVLDPYYQSLEAFGISSEAADLFIEQWTSPGRVYHGLNHLVDILYAIDGDYSSNKIDRQMYDLMVTVAFVHDVIYVPGQSDNEIKSFKFFITHANTEHVGDDRIEAVYKLVESTKYRFIKIDFADPAVCLFLKYDLGPLATGNIPKMISNEKLIFREYQFVDHKVYRKNRVEILQDMIPIIHILLVHAPELGFVINNLRHYINIIISQKIRIAVYHIALRTLSELDISVIKTAEQLFDKVIIAAYLPEFSENISELYDSSLEILPNQTLTYDKNAIDLVRDQIDEHTDVYVLLGDYDMDYIKEEKSKNPDINYVHIL